MDMPLCGKRSLALSIGCTGNGLAQGNACAIENPSKSLFRGENQMTRIYSAFCWLLDRIARLSPVEACVVILVLSFIIKLGYIYILGGGLNAFPAEGSDAAFYEPTARNLLVTGVYGNIPGHPTTAMPPGESCFLALLYGVSNHSIAFAKLAHVALLTLVAALTYFTGRALLSNRLGFWAGVLVAIDPSLAYLSGTFLSDALFIFLMILGIYLLLPRHAENSVFRVIVVGMLFALAGLTRNQGWLFSVVLWLGALITNGRLIRIRAATIILLATMVTTAPWTWRNFKLTNHFIPVSSDGGLTLWSCNNPEFVFRQPMPMSLPVYAIPSGLSGPKIDQYYRKRATEWITAHPIAFVFNGFRKLIALYSFDPLSRRPEVAGFYRLAGLFPYGVLMPFVFLGLILNFRNSNFSVMVWYIFFTTLMAAVFFGDSRIRAPIQPYLYLFGVMGIHTCMKWVDLRRYRIRRRGDKGALD